MGGEIQQTAETEPTGRARSLANLTGGSRKGKPNKSTVVIKEAILAVYGDLQKEKGGDNKHFLAWAMDNPTEFYKLATKLLPLQIEHGGADGGPLQITFRRIDANG